MVRRSARRNKGQPPARFMFDEDVPAEELLARTRMEKSMKELEVLNQKERELERLVSKSLPNMRAKEAHDKDRVDFRASTPKVPAYSQESDEEEEELDRILFKFDTLRTSAEKKQQKKQENITLTPQEFKAAIDAAVRANRPADVKKEPEIADMMQKFLARQTVGGDVRHFDGDTQEWPLFLSWYENTTKVCQYADEEKLVLLQKCLKGEAQEAVQFLLYSPQNVDCIMKSLAERFGRPEYLIKSMIARVKDFPTVRPEKPDTVIKMSALLTNLVAALEKFNQSCYIDNPQLMEEVVAKLPLGMQIQWSEFRETRHVVTMRTLAEWLAVKARAAGNRLMMTVPTVSTKPLKKSERPRTVAATMESSGERSCSFCTEKHAPQNCDIFKKAPVDKRWKMVHNKMLCFSCLRPHHGISSCKRNILCSVNGCDRRHHSLLHFDMTKQPKPQTSNLVHTPEGASESDYSTEGALTAVNTVAHTQKATETMLMKIVPVFVTGPKGCIRTYAFLDEGSTITMIKQSLADRIGASGPSQTLRWQGATPVECKEENSQLIRCEMQGVNKDSKKFFLRNVRTVADMRLPKQSLNVQELSKDWRYLASGHPESMTDAEPEMLIGLDNVPLITSREVIHGQWNSPYLVKTWLGWVVMGKISQKDSHDARIFTVIEHRDELYEMVKDSFSIESYGISPPGQGYSREDKKALEIMAATTKRTCDGRFETGLLWKGQQPPAVPDSKANALKRLKSIERKLDQDPQLAAAYCAKMDDHIEKKYLVKLSDEDKLLPKENVWYLPHFAVFHPAKGKIRVVFDCAAKSHGVSLNDLILKGPDMLRSLPAVLQNFRRGRFAFTGDIQEMFHRVYIRKEDVNYQRILWRGMSRDTPPKEYKMQVMTFGASCSPTLAANAKDVNAREFEREFPDAVKGITEYTYCDDYLGTADSVEESRRLIGQVIEVQKAAGFNVVNWTANDPEILHNLHDNMKSLANKDEPERVLGLWWDSKDDVFTFKTSFHRIPGDMYSMDKVPTMREVLRLVMSVFDPLGFLAMFTVKGRMIIQELWRHMAHWDEEIPEEVLTDWRKFILELLTIDRVKIPRCYSHDLTHAQLIQLHVFGDASGAAYATVAYLRIVTVRGIEVSFVCARSNVAPLKQKTIPRLELQAAVLSARMAVAIKDSLHVDIGEVFFWSDSQTVLKWIRSDSNRYKTFVANRISEIDETTDVRQWKWVPTKENPADMATRNVKCDFSESSRWFLGPEFLQRDEDDWPKERPNDDSEGDDELQHRVCVTISVPKNELLPSFERFSRWSRLVRATAQTRNCALYWISKVRSRKENRTQISGLPPLKVSDLIEAEKSLLREIQSENMTDIQCLKEGRPLPKESDLYSLSPFMDSDGLVKMRSRLANSDVSAKCPIILPPKHPGTKLIISDIHAQHHHQGREQVVNSVRERFHIPRIRVAVKRAWHECQQCKNRRAQPQVPEMAALPAARVNSSVFPFVKSGLDYFGPFEVKVGRRVEKRWGVIFTCMVTRAIHLEVAHSLTTDSAIMAIRRFTSRRGPVTDIFCDNGTNLRGADNEFRRLYEAIDNRRMQEIFSEKLVDFHYNPPAAPHMGGAWERLIRSVKTVLKEVMKTQHPTDEELKTLFAEVEFTMNSRPLTYVSTDPEDDTALTPNHFLIGRAAENRPIGEFDDSDLILRKSWRRAQCLADHYWRRWTREYLPELARRTKWYQPRKPIAVGDVVVVCDSQLPRNKWPLGRVKEIFPGADRRIRSAVIQTRDGDYHRPVTKLAVLDVVASTQEGEM